MAFSIFLAPYGALRSCATELLIEPPRAAPANLLKAHWLATVPIVFLRGVFERVLSQGKDTGLSAGTQSSNFLNAQSAFLTVLGAN